MGRINIHVERNPQGQLAKHIGIQLHKLRQRDLLTMQVVADRSGLSNSYISQVENGQATPGADTLYRLAKTFRVSIDYFFEGYESSHSGSLASDDTGPTGMRCTCKSSTG